MTCVDTETHVAEESETKAKRRKPHKFSVENVDRLLGNARQEMLDPQAVFALLPMRVYQHIADIGCGPGYFTIPLAKYLFDGKVYAIDIQQGMLDVVQDRLTKTRLSNVDLVRSKETKLPLDDGVADGALLVNALHEVTQPNTILKEMSRILKKGGWAAVIDWRKEDTEQGPPVAERIARATAQKSAQDAGFKVVSCYDLNKWNYIILLIRH